MNIKTSRLLFFVLLFGLISFCAGHPRVIVMFDRPEGLKSGDRVLWENQAIGSVGNFQPNPSGKTVVPLQIKRDFSQALTDQSRFFIEADPDRPECQSVKMALLSTGGKQLSDGAIIEGSTPFSIMVEKGSLGLQELPKLFQEALDRLSKGLDRLPLREWQTELEGQIEAWSRQLEKSGEDARRYFQKEILPQLDKAVRDLLRRLKELGKEKESRSMEEKLEQLKRTLHTSG